MQLGVRRQAFESSDMRRLVKSRVSNSSDVRVSLGHAASFRAEHFPEDGFATATSWSRDTATSIDDLMAFVRSS